MMQNQQRTVRYGIGAAALLGVGLTCWTNSRPAMAQDDPPQPPPAPAVGQQNRMRMGNMGSPATLAASGDYVYVLRGNTLYQMKSSDLSLVSQKTLPAPPPPDNANR